MITLDGLSIPFFSAGRRIHSRTVSISRTWTSRTTAVPDWLLGTRALPELPVPPSMPGSVAHDANGAAVPTTPASETDVPVKRSAEADVLVEPQEALRREPRAPPLGVAGMIDPEHESQGLRRRTLATPDASRRASQVDAGQGAPPSAEVVPPPPAHVSKQDIAEQGLDNELSRSRTRSPTLQPSETVQPTDMRAPTVVKTVRFPESETESQ